MNYFKTTRAALLFVLAKSNHMVYPEYTLNQTINNNFSLVNRILAAAQGLLN